MFVLFTSLDPIVYHTRFVTEASKEQSKTFGKDDFVTIYSFLFIWISLYRFTTKTSETGHAQ